MSGFTLSFGSMFSKTWRVHSIFTNVQLNKKVMKDSQLYLVVALLVCIDVVTMTAWQIMDPFYRETKELEPYVNMFFWKLTLISIRWLKLRTRALIKTPSFCGFPEKKIEVLKFVEVPLFFEILRLTWLPIRDNGLSKAELKNGNVNKTQFYGRFRNFHRFSTTLFLPLNVNSFRGVEGNGIGKFYKRM